MPIECAKLGARLLLSCPDYAEIHDRLSRTPGIRHRPLHRALSALLSLPLIGVVAGVFRWAFYSPYNRFAPSTHHRRWTWRCDLSEEQAAAKMEKNLQKAAEEHAAPCALQPTALPAAQPIALRAAGASAQGIRERMEDEQGVCQMDDRWTAAYVIDGHSSDGRGRQLARLAACYLMRHLSRYLQHHHPFTALERAIDESGAQIDRCRDLSHSGCTVLITLIDHDTGSVYTATVGDSEAVVVRGEEWIPLSVVRDWGSPKDHARAQEVFRRTCGYSWSGDPGAEKPRFPGEGYGLNVSRALGDAARLAPVSCKPKITAYQLRPDDLVVLACDGLWDYLPSFGEIVPLVRQSSSPQQLVEAALHRYRSEDNVSVLILTVLNR